MPRPGNGKILHRVLIPPSLGLILEKEGDFDSFTGVVGEYHALSAKKN
jgi:hypothetical protein